MLASLSKRRVARRLGGKERREHVAFCIHKSVVGVDFFLLAFGLALLWFDFLRCF